ncbi:MAG TPA: MtrB/PioB family outer membrane beta-barrel protein [Burkholderiaceae bacterium]|nr:MtrB/PioB family outer membrane beta-barrel protein [Burkholderiaceae bacterium]
MNLWCCGGVLLGACLGVQAAVASAQDATASPDACALSGTLGLGVLASHVSSQDAAKLFEYRDLSDGVLSLIDVQGCAGDQRITFYAEQLGRDDAAIALRGKDLRRGLRYQLHSDALRHEFARGARSPYQSAGADTQTAQLPNLTPSQWSAMDIHYERRNDGGAVQWNYSAQGYVRADMNRLRIEGAQLQSYAQGTSPLRGFASLVIPASSTTQSIGLSWGYQWRDMQFSLSHDISQFDPDATLLRWTNGYFNGLDTSVLAAESDMATWRAQAVFRRLPLRSSFAVRVSSRRLVSDVPMLHVVLSEPPTSGAAGSLPATNPSEAPFHGRIRTHDYSAVLSSQLSATVDTRLSFKQTQRDNQSNDIVFTDLPAGLGCGQAPVSAGPPAASSCHSEHMDWDRRELEAQVFWRMAPSQRLSFTYGADTVERDRRDSARSQDDRFALEWKNEAWARLATRLKVQSISRRAELTRASLGVDPTDPLYLQRFVARYDTTGLSQSVISLGIDGQLARHLDVSLEASVKNNRYQDAILGRTQDAYQSLILSMNYGQMRALRLHAYVGWEGLRNESTHRAINAGSCPVIAPSLTPSPCFDPAQTPTTVAYNWSATERDRTYSAGLGLDWPLRERLLLHASVLWQRAQGRLAPQAQTLPSGAPAAQLIGFDDWGDSERYALNLRGEYRASRHWTVLAGMSYEQLRVNDDQWRDATYWVPAAGSGRTTSYLTGALAYPNYTAVWVYAMAHYRF